ncbi:MAG: AmmeMemoRadiSam system protein A [Sedimenticola sp.]|nr:AmmeMemoRadiSam system protein A [Sedimenticola sp.]
MSSVKKQRTPLSDNDRATLIRVARESIRYGLEHHHALPVVASDYPDSLQQIRASFVTLNLSGRLRGCIGHLEATQPMVKDVSDNAFAAAFQDPRFSALTQDEFLQVDIQLSLLTAAEPLNFNSEQELLSLLHPGEDGLILEEGYNRGTFLPSVWEQLADPKDFLRHLKIKAGLTPDYWSDNLQISRYTTESFS